MRAGDTIVALSSGALPAGVAIIRLSGPKVVQLLRLVAGGVPEPRQLTLRRIGSDSVLDRGLVAYFPAPHSFTGEDCAELQVHGSRAGVKAILRLLVDNGARLAEAGEFTRRAFENGKLDLTAIEGLGDLLEAETEQQRRQALTRLEGGLARHVAGWRESLLDLRAEIEARLDFSDEGDVDDQLPDDFGDAIDALSAQVRHALSDYQRGRLRKDGIRVALAGAPNVGKSSLLNALARSDVAIVTDEAGTTRDVKEVPLDIDGQLYILLDLAGLRQTSSKAEEEGIRRAKLAMESADIVLWLTAPDIAEVAVPDSIAPHLRIGTKADLGTAGPVDLSISTVSGAGLDDLFAAIARLGEQMTGGEAALVSHERDRVALESAIEALERAGTNLAAPELAAEGLRQASLALERLVGRIDAEQVLDRLFSSFCIGK